MRKIDRETQEAFWGHKTLSLSNTMVVTVKDKEVKTECYLHGSKIAELYAERWLSLSNAGYYTNVTKNRLNSILGYLDATGIYGRDWQFWYKKSMHDWPNGRDKLVVDLLTKDVRVEQQWASERILTQTS